MKTFPKDVERWRGLAQLASASSHVPVELILGVIQRESAGNPRAVSHAGAMGLMQLMPKTARIDLDVDDAFDPAQNIHGGAEYLRRQVRIFNGDWAAAIAAYNAGAGADADDVGPGVMDLGKWPSSGWLARMPKETREYVPKVIEYAGWTLRGELAIPPGQAPDTPPPEGPGVGTVILVAGIGLLAGGAVAARLRS